MLLAVDIGNTHTVIGVFGKEDKPEKNWRIASDVIKTTHEYVLVFNDLFRVYGVAKDGIDGAIISSVVPQLTGRVSDCVRELFKVETMLVDQDTNVGLEIMYSNTAEVGADRIANAVALKRMCGGPAIAVDFGTAISFDIIDKNADYVGGVILPGIGIAAEALHQYTAQLPRVSVSKTPRVIANNTVTSIQSGIYHGSLFAVQRIIEEIRNELGIDNCPVIATGGFADVLGEQSNCFTKIEPYLTLYGLKIIWDLNNSECL